MSNIKELTKLTTELEGLLLVLESRDNPHIRHQIFSKWNELSDAFKEFSSDNSHEETHRESSDDSVISQPEVKVEEAVEEEVVDEIDASTEAIERGEENEHEIEDEAFVPIDDSDEDILTVSLDDDDVFAEEPVEMTIQEDREAEFQLQEEQTTPELNVDEMLSRKEAVNLKKVFTLNDKFRFRRALFNQDDAFFARVLDELGSLPTYADACGYVVDQYSWRLDNPDVEDFLSIIKPHYKE